MILEGNTIVDSTDAMDWAETFIDIIKDRPWIVHDPGMMVGWFANAIQAGYRKAQMKYDEEFRTQLRQFGIDPDG